MATKVVIIGGGFAGVFAAKHLSDMSKGDVDIELISDRNYFVFQPLLPEVASGVINAQDAVTPLRLLLPKVKVRL
ncbi:MAG: FAD-dependent oxidoreductase, partial [Shewanella sp.]|nr:FAD-dependent oxidoreductase [Shewanella sp.]